MASNKVVHKIVIGALGVVIVLAFAGVAYGIVTVHRLHNHEAVLPMYATHEYNAPPTWQTLEELLVFIEHSGTDSAIIGDYLYYINPDRNHHMYRFNMETHCHNLYLQIPIFGVITYEETLFFTAYIFSNPGIYAFGFGEFIGTVASDADINKEWRIEDGIIYYYDINGHERKVTVCGRPIAL